MPEPGTASAEARAPIIIPDFLGAVFKQGRNASAVVEWRTGEPLVLTLDVADDDARERWVLENIGTFSYFAASPEIRWRGIVDFWRNDLNSAAGKARLSREKQLRTDGELRAMMAVTAAARAVEASAGSIEAYAGNIIGGDPNSDALDRADTWRTYLLHGDKKKLELVTNHFLVKRYYQRLLTDAGIADHNIDIEQARKSKLAEYLISEKPADASKDWRHRGMVEYTSDYLLGADDNQFIEELGQKGLDDMGRTAAARLAADAFLVDQFTRWEFATDPEGELRIKPTDDWGGDPLRSIVEPSFLPRRVKRMYEDMPGILDGIDEAFRMDAAAAQNEKFAKDRLKPSMTTPLKALVRYNRALFALLGGSRAGGIPLWTKDTLTKDLPTIAERLDEVYGGIEEEKTKFPVGKHVVGAMMARIIYTKALAAVNETEPPNVADRLEYISGAPGGEPFLETMKFLWGDSLDSTEGYLKSLAGPRTGIVFRDNIFLAKKPLIDAFFLLKYNDQRAKGIQRGGVFDIVRGIIDAARATAAVPVRQR